MGLKALTVGNLLFTIITVEQNKQAFKILAEKRIPIIMGFMVFEPYVTIEELIENVRALEELEYYRYICESNLPISLYPKVIPYYGTRLYDFYEKNNLLQNNEFVNGEVNEWYNYLLRWIKSVEQYYRELNISESKLTSSERQTVEVFHKLDMEYWIRSLEMVQDGRIEECSSLIKQQVEKLKNEIMKEELTSMNIL